MARPYIGGTSGGVESVNAAKTIVPADNGKTFMVTDTGSAGYTVTLPTPANAGIGFSCKFIVNCAVGSTLSDGSGEDVVFNDGQTDVMVVNYIDAADAGAVSLVHDRQADTVAFDNTCVTGDSIEFFTDGTLWFAMGLSGVDGGIVVAT
tara:strand:- start:120 stop:566 length:447 start_codon:yes stop_codon:yes gene_type:complete